MMTPAGRPSQLARPCPATLPGSSKPHHSKVICTVAAGRCTAASSITPARYYVFILYERFDLELRILNRGCHHVNGMFVGCLLYADDILLLSPIRL